MPNLKATGTNLAAKIKASGWPDHLPIRFQAKPEPMY